MIKKIAFLLFLSLQLPCLASETALQTTHDLLTSGASNLNLKNNTGAPVTVSGVYLFGIAWIEPGKNCQNGIDGSSNSFQGQYMTGTLIEPIAVEPNRSISIGQNYLYNMVYNFAYWYTILTGDSPCALPGCSWEDDTPSNYCFQVGAVSPNSAYTSSMYASNAPPFAWPTTSPGNIYNYNYDLIPYNHADPDSVYIWIGPFTCSDQTLTCSTPVAQYQTFQP